MRKRIFVLVCVSAFGLLAAPVFARPPTGLMLSDVMASYGFGPSSDYGKSIIYRSRISTVTFEAGSRRVVVNGLTFYLSGEVVKSGTDWMISPVDATEGVGALLFPDRVLRAVHCGAVVLDPGHGGGDPGTLAGRRTEEKRLTLDIAKRVRLKLRACAVDVFMTRDRDATLSLDERCQRADRLGADVFVSIHLNASRDPATAGVETFIAPSAGYSSTGDQDGRNARAHTLACPANRFDGANAVLAYYVHKGVIAYGGAADRGIRRARFYVLRNARCPATLVECGFLSNPREAASLSDDAHRDALAEGIARGILTYLGRVRQGQLPPMNKG